MCRRQLTPGSVPCPVRGVTGEKKKRDDNDDDYDDDYDDDADYDSDFDSEKRSVMNKMLFIIIIMMMIS